MKHTQTYNRTWNNHTQLFRCWITWLYDNYLKEIAPTFIAYIYRHISDPYNFRERIFYTRILSTEKVHFRRNMKCSVIIRVAAVSLNVS